MEEGSLYPALYRMERAGWVAARWGKNENNRRVRIYELTPAGDQQLAAELTGWESFARAVNHQRSDAWKCSIAAAWSTWKLSRWSTAWR